MDHNLSAHLYKLWNRLSSGSYFPMPVKEVSIKKKSGGVRKLGIPTILDRIAQQVVKTHLERILEPVFHESSYGYRPGRNCHQAVEKALDNAFCNDWAIDLDIKSFFDEIDHELLLKALSHYCKDKWVRLYVSRWLQAGIVQGSGCYIDRVSGTPQGGVISPLLANLFLHVAFDAWFKQAFASHRFERYADDIIVHCRTEYQAKQILKQIRIRFETCKLKLNEEKTKIVNLRGSSEEKYSKGFNFLGFTVRPDWFKTKAGWKLLPSLRISKGAISRIGEKLRRKKIHRWRTSLESIARELNPVIRGIINYYGIVKSYYMNRIWYEMNVRLLKWVSWEKRLQKRGSRRWLKQKYKERPNLFAHWKLVYP
jgi:group II intron reverse transcriptase/maturase